MPGVCRALVLKPVDKHIREGSFQPRLGLDPGLVPTGLLPVWREHKIKRPTGLLPVW